MIEREWKTVIDPFRAKMIEPLAFTTRAERERALEQAGGDLRWVADDKILLDLRSDAAPTATSTEQRSAMIRGEESRAGTASRQRLEKAVRDLTGLRHVFPVHGSEAAARVIFRTLAGRKRIVMSNSRFEWTSSRGGDVAFEAYHFPVPDAQAVDTPVPFKGDIDLHALESQIRVVRASSVAMILIEVTNDSLGGQPVSLANIRAAREIARHYKIPFFLAAPRFAENAWLIKSRERGYSRATPREIAQEMFSNCDGCWMGSAHDAFVDAVGFMALNDETLAHECRAALVSGPSTATGDLSGRDLEALAVGISEALDERHLSFRARTIASLGDGLRRAGVPLVEPPGGHGVDIDAKRFLPHLALDAHCAQALADELYLTAGVRTSTAPGGLVRLAIPRRAYTASHLQFLIEIATDVALRAADVRAPRTRDLSAQESIR